MTKVKGFTEAIISQIVDLELMYSGYSGSPDFISQSFRVPPQSDRLPWQLSKVVTMVKGPHCMELWAPHADRQHKARASPHSATGQKPCPESE